MKLRVVVDTNIFISAILRGGNPQKIIDLWLKQQIIVLTSSFLVSEVLLTIEKFGVSQTNVNQLQRNFFQFSLKIFPETKTVLCRDPKDNQILDLCRAGRADVLITGDKDLLTLKKFKSTKIVTPAQFLNEINSVEL